MNTLFCSKSKKNDYERKDHKDHSYAHKSSDKRTVAAISSGLAKLENQLKYSSRSRNSKCKGSHHYHQHDSHIEDSDMSYSSMSRARDLGQVLEMKFKKTIKLIFALVLYALQMHVLQIETNLT